MNTITIMQSDLLDILFEGRNKDYGAYELRRTYNKRILYSLAGMISIILLGIVLHLLSGRSFQKSATLILDNGDNVLTQLDPEPPLPPPLPLPPPPLPKVPPPPIATVQFSNIRVSKDKDVVKPPPDVNQLETALIDIKTQDGKAFDGTIIAPPQDIKGSNILAQPPKKNPDEDKTFIVVEKDAKFPGGDEAWRKYVTRAIEKELDEFTDDDYGIVVVKFVVDREGNVSEVQAANMKGSKLAEVAINAIRKGPKWIPAIQNGQYVKAWRLQPVTLQKQ